MKLEVKERKTREDNLEADIYSPASSTHQGIPDGSCARDLQPPAVPRCVNMHSLLPHLSSPSPVIICLIHLSSKSVLQKTYGVRSVFRNDSETSFPSSFALRTCVTREDMAPNTSRRVRNVSKRCLRLVLFYVSVITLEN